MKKKIWKVTKDTNVYGITITSSPAIEEIGIKMNKEEKLIYQKATSKHQIVSAVAIPDQLIYRDWIWYDEETDSVQRGLYLQYDAEVVEHLAHKFLEQGNQRNISIEHEDYSKTFGYVAETWIKSDKTKDKSVALGLDSKIPVGTWFALTQLTDIQTDEKIDEGELLPAYSLEALGVFDEIKQQLQEKINQHKENVENSNIYLQNEDNMLKEELIKLLEIEDNQEIKQLKDEIEQLKQTIEQSKIVAESTDVQVIEQKEEEAKADVVETNVEMETIKQELEQSKQSNSELQAQLEASANELKQVKDELEKLSKKPSTEEEKIEQSKPKITFKNFINL
jgi:hypothetical protein